MIITLKQFLLKKTARSGPAVMKKCSGSDIEQELDIAIEAGIDYFVVDGAEGGTHAPDV
jgi:glutamate synthase domain-containing protein 2